LSTNTTAIPPSLDRVLALVYDSYIPDRTAEIAFWTGQAATCGTRVLFPIAETGEVASGLAMAGFTVVAGHTSPAMLDISRARRKTLPAPVRKRLSLLTSSGARMRFPGPDYDFCCLPGRVFETLVEDAGRMACLRACARRLRPGGRLGMELSSRLSPPVPPWILQIRRSLPPGIEAQRRRYLVPLQELGLLRIRELLRINLAAPEGINSSPKVLVFRYGFPLRIASGREMVELLNSCGFREVEVLEFSASGASGLIDSEDALPGSPAMIVLARKG